MTDGEQEFTPGQRVHWTEHGRWYSGRIVRRLTEPVVIKGKRLDATPDAPRWLVETRHGRAAHPASAIVPADRSARPDEPDEGQLRLL